MDKIRKYIRLIGKIVIGLLIVINFFAILGAFMSEDKKRSYDSFQDNITYKNDTPYAEAKCSQTPTHVINRISKKIIPSSSFFVQSTDFASVYFVSGAINNNGEKYFGVWSTGSIENEKPSMIFSINDIAKNTTSFPFGPDTSTKVSMNDHGASVAYNCALHSVKQ